MKLSIIIVNWNSTELTKDCIASIYANAQRLNHEIIVVDNASHDDSWRTISRVFPQVKLVRSDSNLGFARANNVGVKHASGETILFLNPDTIVLCDALQRMLLRLTGAPEIGAVGCRLLNRDLSLQISCVQAFPTIANQILGLDCLKRRWPRLPLWGTRALFSEDLSGAIEVEAVSGACLMVKRQVFEKAGRFSSEYFMYAEEIDLCYKIRQAGYKICYIGDAQVIHFGGQSSKQREPGFVDIAMRESIYGFLRKFRGRAYARAYRAALLLSAAARLAILTPLLAAPHRLLKREDVRCAFRKWRRIATWACGAPCQRPHSPAGRVRSVTVR